MDTNNRELEAKNNLESGRTKGIILAITGAVMWGIMGVFVRGLSDVGYSSYDISFARYVMASISFLTYKAITQPKILKIDMKGLVICFLYGIFAYAIGSVAYGISVERIPVAVATVLMFMCPIWVVVLGVVIFKEKLEKQTVLAILICIIGGTMVANVFGSTSGKLDMIGVIAGVVNGFGVALQIMIPRYFAKSYDRDTMLVYGFLGAAFGLYFLTDFNVIGESLVGSDSTKVLFNLFGIGIMCTTVANVAFVKSTKYIGTTTSSILSALEVVVGAIVGLMIFQESMSTMQVIGATIVVVASLGPSLLSKKSEPKNKTESPEIDL